MFKRLLAAFLAITLLLPFVPALKPVRANSGPVEERIVQIRTAYWDVWKHADGNWQSTGRPGGSYSKEEPLTVPSKFADGYKDIRAEIKQGPPSMADNNDPNLEAKYKKNWDDYQYYTLGKSANISSYSLSGTQTANLSFTLPEPADFEAVNIKDEEEAKGQSFASNVEGWRYYLPFVVYWYGTKETKPEKEINLFRRLGDNRLAIHKPERDSAFGVGVHANWELVYQAIPRAITSTVNNHAQVGRFDEPENQQYVKPMVLWNFEWRTYDNGKTITVTNKSKVPDTLYLELHKDKYQEGNPVEAFALKQGESIKLNYPTNQGYFLYAATPPERFGFWDDVTDRDGWGDKYTTKIPPSLQEAVDELLERHRKNISN